MGLTTPFLLQAAERGIEVVLLSEQGTSGGRLTPLTSSDPSARCAQYRAADDADRTRKAAAGFVSGKVGNMRVTLLRTARRQQDTAAAEAADSLERALEDLDGPLSLDEILGLEGSSTRAYFQGVQRMLDPIWGFNHCCRATGRACSCRSSSARPARSTSSARCGPRCASASTR